MPRQILTIAIDSSETPVREATEAAALANFGEGTTVLDVSNDIPSGPIRFFKKRGMSVLKKAGRFYVSGDPKRHLVHATLYIPAEFFTRRGG